MNKKIENTSLQPSVSHPELDMFKAFIDINKLDKDILAEIFGVPRQRMRTTSRTIQGQCRK